MKKKLLPPLLLLLMVAFNGANATNLVWAKSLNYQINAGVYTLPLQATGDGKLLELLYSYGLDTCDLDLGPGFDNMEDSATLRQSALVKYDTDGTLLWKRKWNSVGNYGASMKEFVQRPSDGHIFLYGYFESVFDADPGPGVVSLSAGTGAALVIVELDASGQYVWSGSLNCTTTNISAGSIAINSYGYLVITGKFGGTIDLDPSAASYPLTSTSPAYMQDFVATLIYLNGTSTYQPYWGWTFPYAGGDLTSNSLVTDPSNNDIYIAGRFSGTKDMDVAGNPVHNVVSAGGDDLFIARYDYAGNYVSSFSLGSSGGEGAFLLQMINGELMFVGTTDGSIDLDPGPGISIISAIGASHYRDFIVRYSTSYAFQWGTYFSSNDNMSQITDFDVYNGILYVNVVDATTFDADPEVGIVNVNPGPVGASAIVGLSYFSGAYVESLAYDATASGVLTYELMMNGKIYSQGSFKNGFDADPNSGSVVLNNPYANASSTYNIFYAAYDFLSVEPSVQVSNLHFTAGTDTTVTVAFTRGNGTKRLVLVQRDTIITDLPDDAMFYSNDTVYGNGTQFANGAYAVYLDTGEVFTLSGIDTTGGHKYYFAAFEMSGFSSAINFLLSNAPTAVYQGPVASGISSTERTNFKLYPNPAHESVTLQMDGPLENAWVRITDLQGRLVSESRSTAAIQNIAIENITPGIYLAEVRTNSGSYTSKFIKE